MEGKFIQQTQLEVKEFLVLSRYGSGTGIDAADQSVEERISKGLSSTNGSEDPAKYGAFRGQQRLVQLKKIPMPYVAKAKEQVGKEYNNRVHWNSWFSRAKAWVWCYALLWA